MSEGGPNVLTSGLVSITFRQLTPEQIVDLVAETGLAAIEWGGDVHVPHGEVAPARDVRRRTEEAGLIVASYGSYLRVGHDDPGGDPEAGRARLEACRATADAQQLAAIDRRLASPPPRAGEALGPGERSQVEALVQRWQQVKRYVPGHGAESLPWATTLIAGLLFVVFGLEEALGGSMNPDTLELVGALVPERVMAGQWWRVVSALFVHMGPLHLFMNTVGLFALGTFIERRLGAIALTVLFFASGALPMLTHVLMAPITEATPSVGASGGVPTYPTTSP